MQLDWVNVWMTYNWGGCKNTAVVKTIQKFSLCKSQGTVSLLCSVHTTHLHDLLYTDYCCTAFRRTS